MFNSCFLYMRRLAFDCKFFVERFVITSFKICCGKVVTCLSGWLRPKMLLKEIWNVFSQFNFKSFLKILLDTFKCTSVYKGLVLFHYYVYTYVRMNVLDLSRVWIIAVHVYILLFAILEFAFLHLLVETLVSVDYVWLFLVI